MALRLNGSTSGYVEIDAPAVAGDNTLTLPSTPNGSLVALDSSGRLGIGTSSPLSYLNVVGTGTTAVDFTATDAQASANTSLLVHNNTNNNGAFSQLILRQRISNQTDIRLTAWNGDNPYFTIAAQSRLSGQEYAKPLLTIGATSGNVGIGTTTPDTLLNLSSSGTGYRFKIDDTTNNHTVGIYSDATSARIVSLNNAENAYEPFAISGADVRFWIGNSEKARIDAGGKLLVGTTTAINTDSNAVIQAASASGGYYIAARNDTSVTVDNTIGGMRFYGNDSDSIYDECARIECLGDGTHSSTSKPSRLGFYTTGSGAQSPSERLRIANTGALGLSGANYGTSGQVLTSNGSGSAPSWQDGGGAGAAIFAWVNYASNGAIQDSLGISSVTKGGGGYYTFNLSSSQPDDNYVAVGSNGNQSIHNVIPGTTTIGTIHIRRTDGAGVDHPGWAGAFR